MILLYRRTQTQRVLKVLTSSTQTHKRTKNSRKNVLKIFFFFIGRFIMHKKSSHLTPASWRVHVDDKENKMHTHFTTAARPSGYIVGQLPLHPLPRLIQ
jgi:hypothetical protein